MAKWKELGEVPDSDDESAWDSQESLSDAPDPTSTSAADAIREPPEVEIPAASESQDIWAVPFSTQASIDERHGIESPNPLVPEPSLPIPGSPTSEHRPEPPLSSLIDLGQIIEVDISVNGPRTQGQAEIEEPAPSSRADIPNPPKSPVSLVQDDPVAQETDHTGNQQTLPGRSLRPRKPIQEHPYLIESAQYSKTWKSHGLRPVRVLAEEEKRQEDDSQEQEFEDDSQITHKGTGQGASAESQATMNSEALSELDRISLFEEEGLTPTPEPHPVGPEQALQISQEEDDEFPDPNDVEKWKLNRNAHRVHKRHASPKRSSIAKRSRLDDSVRVGQNSPPLPDIDNIFDIPTSPPHPRPQIVIPIASVNRHRPRNAAALAHESNTNFSWRMPSLSPPYQHREIIDLTAQVDEDGNGNRNDDSDDHTDFERENDQIRQVARRLRGVLPASWLRLDQQISLQKNKPTARHRSPDSSPERSVRKGVAQRRLLSAQGNNNAAPFHPDESDDSDDSDSTVQVIQRESVLQLDVTGPALEDGAVSVIEEDHIDSMFSRGKRPSTSSSVLQRKRKRRQSMFNGQSEQRKRQQRITVHLDRNNPVPSQPSRLQESKDNTGAERSEKSTRRSRKALHTRPPWLSILDVVEPDAPDFIRIAARTARRRRDQGRSSPSRKAIMLGTRQDTIDAVGVLRRWNEGMIHPRPSNSLSSCPEHLQDEPIRPISQTHSTPISSNYGASRVNLTTRFSKPRLTAKQTSMDDFIDAAATNGSGRGPPTDTPVAGRRRPRTSSYRPAQLEIPGNATTSSTFDVRKRALDAIYRRSRKSLPASRNALLEQSISMQAPAQHQSPTSECPKPAQNNGASKPPRPKTRAIPRKQIRPQFVDVSAPQHAHANDPLPRELSPPMVVLDISKSEETGKLLGLAPYGTHYTQHFEVFPLDRGVFFHESTIIGNSRLKRALDDKTLSNLSGQRGRCTFTIDEQNLSWGLWDSRVSSELGIVFDWVMDRLCTSCAYPELEAPRVVEATEFVLLYLQDHLSFTDPEGSNLFAIRLADVLQGFEQRLKELVGDDSQCVVPHLVEVATRVLVITVQALRLCQRFENISEAFRLEETLKRLAASTAGILLRTGLQEVRDTYDRLQQMSFREKGIRNDQYYIICWVVLIRILEEARLPRAGFWEVVSSVILSSSADGTFDAAVLEQAWRTLFTLLPLGEFDNTGVAIPDMRHTAPVEGWALPQRLVQRVFNLYQSNSRQSAGFNDYLRAVVSRCHYLVEQWGWHRSNAILGAIFDFFAAQDLHNLRNEEVYQSPQFLEELSESPSLAVSHEDRCFHVYLKLIAISIKRLRKLGMMKEIKNLVTRLLPNHSRQYDKMMETHEADIAALRNHHDLLCTLFWAAPPDMRPSSQSIEGLVVLGNSHKEACLISLRAWSRLSRFVVSSTEDISAYKMLADWQRNISQQVLDQFLSVETEIDQQLQGMSAEASKTITQEHKNTVISRNKKVAMDLLYVSMKSFLDVMRHTRTLGAASFVLNYYPLEQILTCLPFSSAKSDWSILQIILDIIDYYLAQINEFTFAEPLQSQHQEDAIMLLERKFALPLISVVRGAVCIPSHNMGIGPVRDRGLRIEHAVALVARIGACLVHSRLVRPGEFFKAGKYNLFQDISKHTTSPARKYVALFLATMIDRGVVDFKDLALMPLEVFLCELIKPSQYLSYENRLAMGFKQLGEAYIEKAAIKSGDTPDYNSNRDLFDHNIVSMRKALRQAEASQKVHLQTLFSKALRLVMDRMKADLKSMTLNSAEHLNYVDFVRSIISLIRSQNLCSVDSFFYQISQEYSPSREDPRLQMAGILSWGNRLEEGDSKAMSGLFYLLFPSFKIALTNGELAKEANILKESMRHVHVFNFMLNTMLPAVVSTAAQVSNGWVLIDTYVESIDARLSQACIHQQIGNNLMDFQALHAAVLAGLGKLQSRTSARLDSEDIVSLTSIVKTLNILSPSVTAFLIDEPESPVVSDITEIIDHITEFTSAAYAYVSEFLQSNDGDALAFEHHRLFAGLCVPRFGTALRCNELIEKFSSHMVHDIHSNWVSNGSTITVKGPSRPQRPSATQSGQGTRLPQWEKRTLLQNLSHELKMWNYAHDMTMREATHRSLIDELFF